MQALFARNLRKKSSRLSSHYTLDHFAGVLCTRPWLHSISSRSEELIDWKAEAYLNSKSQYVESQWSLLGSLPGAAGPARGACIELFGNEGKVKWVWPRYFLGVGCGVWPLKVEPEPNQPQVSSFILPMKPLLGCISLLNSDEDTLERKIAICR